MDFVEIGAETADEHGFSASRIDNKQHDFFKKTERPNSYIESGASVILRYLIYVMFS